MLNILINCHTHCIGQIKNLRLLALANNTIGKNVKERVLFKNYKERFDRSLHLWYSMFLILRTVFGMLICCGVLQNKYVLAPIIFFCKLQI